MDHEETEEANEQNLMALVVAAVTAERSAAAVAATQKLEPHMQENPAKVVQEEVDKPAACALIETAALTQSAMDTAVSPAEPAALVINSKHRRED